MRQSQLRQGPAGIGACKDICRNTIGTANDENDVFASRLPIVEFIGKCLAGPLHAAFVQDDNVFGWFDFDEYLLAFRFPGYVDRCTLLSLCRGNRFQAKLPLPRQSRDILAIGGVDPRRLPITDCNQANVHRQVSVAARSLVGLKDQSFSRL